LNHQLERFNVYGKCKEQSTKNKGQQFSSPGKPGSTQFIHQVEQFFWRIHETPFRSFAFDWHARAAAAVAAKDSASVAKQPPPRQLIWLRKEVWTRSLPAQMRAYLSFIASDEMEGRDTPSRGLDTTAKFIAMNLTRWGFKARRRRWLLLAADSLAARSSGCCTNPG